MNAADVVTLFCPPPGTWPMLSREPTFDWTLNSSFSFLISMFPPPADSREPVNTRSTTHSLVPAPLTGTHLACDGCCLWSHISKSRCSGRSSCARSGPETTTSGKRFDLKEDSEKCLHAAPEGQIPVSHICPAVRCRRLVH